MIIGKKYRVMGWHSQERYLTAKELFELVQKDSKSDYNWFASATQLYAACHQVNFPAKYAEGIMLIVLNCYANLELKQTEDSRRESTAQKTINQIYAELVSDDETTVRIKEKYLRNVIEGITIYTRSEERLRWHHGEYFLGLEKNWKTNMFEKYKAKKAIDFDQMRSELYTEYDAFLTEANKDEEVQREDKEERTSIGNFLAHINFTEL